MPHRKLLFLFLSVAIVLSCSAMAQDATLKVFVNPQQAYIFIDGKAYDNGHQTLRLAPGKHEVFVHNYGYRPIVREVELAPGAEEQLDITLEPAGGPVAGPFGAIQIESNATHAAVLLNGKKPEYLVGYVDEFNNHMWWKQQLLVPVGSHTVTVTEGGKELWSGKVNVGENQRVILYFGAPGEPDIVVKNWPEGSKITSVPRFAAGVASATVAVAPVTANFAVSPKQIDCNVPGKLAWTTTETLDRSITSDSGNFNELPLVGEETVSPRKTTTYHFITAGPGGTIEASDTLNVNPVVQATLTATPEVHYLRVGDKVLQQESATLTWSTANADNIVLEPIGKVNASGTEKVTLTPEKNTFGPVDEGKLYKIVATNVCGGSETQQATVRMVGLIEPMISSVYFPTSYPDRGHPTKGLLFSQQKYLERVAEVFKAYIHAVPDAKLRLTGTADIRGSEKSNFALSGRRVAVVKEFLVSKGVPAEAIIAEPKGEEAPLDKTTVAQLEINNFQQSEASLFTNLNVKWLAYNRRVDIAIQPEGLESARIYPHQAKDATLLVQSTRPRESKIHEASDVEVVMAAND